MKVVSLETMGCDGGWRIFSFLKVTTDSGIVGWSEFIEGFGNRGLSGVIDALAPFVVGQDPQRYERVTASLHVRTRQARGGMNQQAIAAIENALLDITGKAYGLPVYALFGGPVRDRLPIYWSHCGTWHISFPEHLGVPRMTTYDDLARHAEAIRARGINAIKTHVHPMRDGRLSKFDPGFGITAGWPELNWDMVTLLIRPSLS